MNHSIFIRSYDRDAAWLKVCFAQLTKYAAGWDKTIVVTDPEAVEIPALCEAWGIPCMPSPYLTDLPGYLQQQLDKLHADTFLPDADTITFVDSDAWPYASFTPESARIIPSIEILYSPWDEMGDAKDAWMEITGRALLREPPYEFMRRLPLSYRPETLLAARTWMETHHGASVAEVIESLGSISEFNFLGAWAWFNRHDDYTWTYVDSKNPPTSSLPVRQFWSHGSLAEAMETIADMELAQ